MEYEADRVNDTAGEPSLSQMVYKAIHMLHRNKRGYFLLVEGIDLDKHIRMNYNKSTRCQIFRDLLVYPIKHP